MVEMVSQGGSDNFPRDGGGPAGQFHAAEMFNVLQAVQFGCGVAARTYTMTVTGGNRVVTIPIFQAVVPDGAGAFVLINKTSATDVSITASHTTLPRNDYVYVNSSGTVTVEDGTATAETGDVEEAPMDALNTNRIMLCKVKVPINQTNVLVVDVYGRAIFTDIYRQRELVAWLANDVQNPSLGTIPVGSWVVPPLLHVTEAFNSYGTDEIRVGYDSDQDAFGLLPAVDSSGFKNMAAGTLEGYNGTLRAAEAYYINGGSEPTTGKAVVILPYRFLVPEVS